MKKRKLLALFLAAATTLSLVACGSSSTTSTDSTTGGDSSTTTATELVIARASDSDNLDPVLQDGNINIWVYTLCFEPLVTLSDDGSEIIPCLAESWSVSDDNLVYTFNIVPGLTFSNGEDVEMEDFIWSYERAMTTEESVWYDLCVSIDSVSSPADDVFEITMKEPTPVAMSTFTLFNLVITDKSHFDEVGADEYALGPIGTGAYKFETWNQGEYIRLVANEYYRDADSVATESIRFNVVADDNTRIMQLQNGDVDIITDAPWSRLSEVDADADLQTIMSTSTEMRCLEFNCLSGPTADVRVRQAIAMTIDKQIIVDLVLYGYGEVADSFLAPSLPYYIEADTYDVDIEAAKALLAEAGYADGFDITLTVTSGNTYYEQMAVIIQSQLKEIGINVSIETLETGTFNTKRTAMELEMFFGGWTSDIPDASQQTSYYCDPSMANCVHTGWSNDRVTELTKAAAIEMDETLRAEMYAEIQQIYAEECPTIPIYYAPYSVAADATVEGFVQLPTGIYRLENTTVAG